VKQVVKRAAAEKDRFLQLLKQVAEGLRLCHNPQEYLQERDRLVQFIQKNISSVEGTHQLHYQLDHKFEVARADTLRERINALEQELRNSQQAL
jgi:hypothetical protein